MYFYLYFSILLCECANYNILFIDRHGWCAFYWSPQKVETIDACWKFCLC